MSGQQGHQRQVMPPSQVTGDMQQQRRSLLGPRCLGLSYHWPQKSDQQTAATPSLIGLLAADGTELSLSRTQGASALNAWLQVADDLR